MVQMQEIYGKRPLLHYLHAAHQSLSRPMEEAPVIFVDTPGALQQMVTDLQAARHIAIDLENHSFR